MRCGGKLPPEPRRCRLRAGRLEVAFLEWGPADGRLAVLLHGFPDGAHAWDAVAAALAGQGWRVVVPWLRGHGGTRFLNEATPRSGEQAALGDDLRALLAALDAGPAMLAGYDWGGRAACVVAALWPHMVRGLVTGGGYNIQHIASAGRPAAPAQEAAYWYQWYFLTERGRAGLATDRAGIARLLWRMWSPTWDFSDATLARAAPSWDNPDYVEVVIHSYRHRHNAAPGDPALAGIEAALAARPRIAVPAISLCGTMDTVAQPKRPDTDAPMFAAFYERRLLENVGHFLPHEAPAAVVRAVADLAQV
jgi:pimeloyl-ACP methyl ester carboxylesterase